MNSHGYALLRMMGLKDDTKGERIRRTMRSTNNALAPFYCLRKDHKKVEQGREAEGPKTRPLCGATDCLTRRTSVLLSKLLVEVIPPNISQCNSTEDLIEEVKISIVKSEYNIVQLTDYVIFIDSMLLTHIPYVNPLLYAQSLPI